MIKVKVEKGILGSTDDFFANVSVANEITRAEHTEEGNKVDNKESDLLTLEVKDPHQDAGDKGKSEDMPQKETDGDSEEKTANMNDLESERLQIRRYLRTTMTLENTDRSSYITPNAWEACFPDELSLHAWNGKQYWSTTLKDIGEITESPSRRAFERNKKTLDDVCIRIGDPTQHLVQEQSIMLNMEIEFSGHVWNEFNVEGPSHGPSAATRGLSSLCSSDTGGFTSAASTSLTAQKESHLHIDSNLSNPVDADAMEDTDEDFADCLLRMPLPFEGKKVNNL